MVSLNFRQKKTLPVVGRQGWFLSVWFDGGKNRRNNKMKKKGMLKEMFP